MSRQQALESITHHFDSGEFMHDLARRVAIRTESQNPESHPFLRSYLTDEIAPALQPMGYEIHILDNPAGIAAPFLVARRMEHPDLPTILTYGHGDVIRGLDAQWHTGLIQMSVQDDLNYGKLWDSIFPECYPWQDHVELIWSW